MHDSCTEFITLAELAARSGTTVPCTGNLPVKLDTRDSVWFIERGAVNLFLLETSDGVEQAAPHHMLRREANTLMPGVAPFQEDFGKTGTLSMIAKGRPDTLLRCLPTSALSEVDPSELAAQVDSWLIDFTHTLSRFVNRIPRPTALAEPGKMQKLTPGILSVRRGVVWVSKPSSGNGLYMDIVDPAQASETGDQPEAVIPLTRTSWLTLSDEVTLACSSTRSLAQEGRLLSSLASFHASAFEVERINLRLALVDDANLERARTESRQAAEKAARQRLLNIYDLPAEDDIGSGKLPLAEALHIIGRHENIQFKIPVRSGPSAAPVGLVDILDASGIRARCVSLRNEPSWWRSDSNALLAFRTGDGLPLALLPGIFGRYRAVDPVSKRSLRVTAHRAAELEDKAWMFYRALPEQNTKPSDLMRFALQGSGGDLLRLILAGLPGGLIKLLPALALGFVAHHVAAGGTSGTLYALAVMLAVFGLLGTLLQLFQYTAIMRFEGRSATRVEAAFWDRLMRLPLRFLHRYPTGDLAMSAMTFQNLRDGLQNVIADSLLSIIFLLPVFVVIFFCNFTLGVVTLLFSLASLLVVVLLGLRQILPHGKMIRATRHVTGRLFQFIKGIAKLRVEHAEGSAYAIWAKDYRQQKRAEIELGTYEGHLRAFGAALPFLAGGVLLFAVMTAQVQEITVSDFLIVYSVFIVFLSAVARVGESFGIVAAMMPAFDQLRPLLSAIPENEVEGEPVEHLGGDLLFDRVSFRYDPDGPLILDDITIHASPGEFVAIAGESGSGKSTLFRLALGIDRPTVGAVYYDGRDLKQLNLKQVRRNIGTVPQSVDLYPNDLWDNLVGYRTEVTTGEVWKATRIAEIEYQIKSMPMGMMTMVGSGAVLSGGESQRIMIARSVIGNPRIMLLDEATNWLDNENQAKVMQNLTALTSTRLVIAHRLSTLEQADRIYVLQAGKVVQCGSFDELMQQDGVFQGLVKRQLA